MASKYTTLGALSEVAGSALDSLANDDAAVGSAQDNSAGNPLGRFEIYLATQGSARDASAQVSLLLVPEGASGNYGDISTLKTAGGFIARDVTGKAMTFVLDAAVTARYITCDGVRVPHGNFKVGLLNETGQALEDGTIGNTVKMALYGIEDT